MSAAAAAQTPPTEPSPASTLGAFFTQEKVATNVLDAFHDSLGTSADIELSELIELPEEMAFDNFKTAKFMG